MNSPKSKPLDAAVAVLGAGLVLGVLMRVIENARPLAALLGF